MSLRFAFTAFAIAAFCFLYAENAHAWQEANAYLNEPRVYGCATFWEEYIILLGGSKQFPAFSSSHNSNESIPPPSAEVASFDLIDQAYWSQSFFSSLPVGIAGPS